MSDPDAWGWGASGAYQVPTAANSRGPSRRGTLATPGLELGADMADPPKSHGTMLQGSTSAPASVEERAQPPTVAPPDPVVDLAPFGRHPPVSNAPRDAQSAMPGVAAPYVPHPAAPGPQAPSVVASPRPESLAPVAPAVAATPNRSSGVGEASMSEPSFPSQPSAPESPAAAPGEFGASGQSVYEFSGAADTGPTGPAAGPDPAETFGEAPSLNLDLQDEAPRSNLGSGRSTWVVVGIGIALLAGVTSYLVLRSPREAEAADATAVAASKEDAADASPASGAPPAEPEAKPADEKAPAADAAVAGAPGADAKAPALEPKADAAKPAEPVPVEPPASEPKAPASPKSGATKAPANSKSSSGTKKKKTSGKKKIKSKRPPRDPFKGLPAPPG